MPATESKPDGLLAQHHLLLEIIHTAWATRLDHKVAAVIIERYYGKFGNSRASLRYLADRTKATRPNVIASVRRLTEHGAFSVIREGVGTRPTEYALHFNFSSGIADDTSASGIAGDTSCGIADDTSRSDSGIAGDTKTYLHVPADKAGIHEGSMFSAPATPPLSDGLKATDAGSAEGDGFDEFWKIWPRKHGLKKARAAWGKISAKANVIITAASAWAEHYQKHATDKKWIAEPANWLVGERWMEDLPIIHGDAKGAAISKAKANAPMKARNDGKPDVGIPTSEKPDFTVYPDQSAGGTIERVEDWTDPDDGSKSLTIYYRTHRGEEIEQTLVYHSDDAAEQDTGQRELRILLEAVELESVDHAEELVGRKVDLMINSGKFISCSKPWVPAPKAARNFPRFADVVKNTPRSGWYKMIGTAPLDDDVAA